MGLRVVVTVGVLVAAKGRGDISAMAPMLEALSASGFWLSASLVRRVLRAVGEQP